MSKAALRSIPANAIYNKNISLKPFLAYSSLKWPFIYASVAIKYLVGVFSRFLFYKLKLLTIFDVVEMKYFTDLD